MLFLNVDNTVTDCNEVEDANVQENDMVQDYRQLSRKKQVRLENWRYVGLPISLK